MIDARAAFTEELGRRGLPVSYDSETDRYRVLLPSGSAMVCISNLAKDLERDGDLTRVVRFVDTVEASGRPADTRLERRQLYWVLEPNDYVEKADFRIAISDRVDRVLVRLSDDHKAITWVSPKMIVDAELTEELAFSAGFANLDTALFKSKLEFSEIGPVRLGFISAAIPMKASLILAPSLRRFVGEEIGWPVLAVVPDRDFLYLWAARHQDFVGRVGRTVVKEYSTASYPISTEVYSINDDGIKAIGEFPRQA